MATEIVMPALEMAQDSGRLVRWLKAEGELVRKGEPLMEIETDKVTVEIEATASGILASVSAHGGDEVPVGQVIGLLLSEDESAATLPASITASPVARRLAAGAEQIEKANELSLESPQSTSKPILQSIPASPKARRLAAEHGLELSAVAGSGPDGAVLAADVQAYLIQVKAHIEDNYRVIPLIGMRKIIAARLYTSYQTAPHIALTVSVNMTETLRLLEKLKPTIQTETGYNLTITTVLSKAVSTVLVKHPRLNAHLIENEIREYTVVHLGVAVALDDGLIVPIIRNVEHKGLAVIQSDLHDLTQRARAGKLKSHEIKGSTFTLSNLGMFGIEQFTAILNPPEVGILAVGVIEERAIGVDGQVVLRPMMQMTLNVDHRAVDGAVAAAFLKTLKETLENPYRFII